MNLSECNKIQNNLYDYLQNNLDTTIRSLVESHLSQCEKCRSELEILKKTLGSLDQLEALSPQPSFCEKVLGKIELEEQQQSQLSRRLTAFFDSLVNKWAYVGIAALLVISFFAGKMYQSSLAPQRWIISQPKEIELKKESSISPNPIVIEIERNKFFDSFKQLLTLIEAHNGQLIRLKVVEYGIELIIQLDQTKEEILFKELNQLGRITMTKSGYRNKEGNIFIMIKTQ